MIFKLYFKLHDLKVTFQMAGFLLSDALGPPYRSFNEKVKKGQAFSYHILFSLQSTTVFSFEEWIRESGLKHQYTSIKQEMWGPGYLIKKKKIIRV